MNSRVIFTFLLVLVASIFVSVQAHKRFNAPIYEPERCICDCAQPVLPNKPFHGHGGYHQQPPRQGGYGSSGAYAVSGSYGSGNGQASGGY